MTRDEEIWHERRRELLQMIREAGISTGGHPMNPLSAYPEQLERFAALVAAAEREACKAIAEKNLGNTAMLTSMPPLSDAAWRIRNAIRARGEV
jgi:hypothetical protein